MEEQDCSPAWIINICVKESCRFVFVSDFCNPF